MRIRYGSTEYEATLSSDEKNGRVYLSYPDRSVSGGFSSVGAGSFSVIHRYDRDWKSTHTTSYWRRVRGSMTQEEKALWVRYIKNRIESNRQDRQRIMSDVCFPSHKGAKHLYTEGIGGTLHHYSCSVCGRNWTEDSGD